MQQVKYKNNYVNKDTGKAPDPNTSLEPHHTHFILVDTDVCVEKDGEKAYGGEIELRAAFEKVWHLQFIMTIYCYVVDAFSRHESLAVLLQFTTCHIPVINLIILI